MLQTLAPSITAKTNNISAAPIYINNMLIRDVLRDISFFVFLVYVLEIYQILVVMRGFKSEHVAPWGTRLKTLTIYIDFI